MESMKCPVCATDIIENENVVICPYCERFHHHECWDYNGHACGIHACSGRGHLNFYRFSKSLCDSIPPANRSSASSPVSVTSATLIPADIDETTYWITTLALSPIIYGFLTFVLHKITFDVMGFSINRLLGLGINNPSIHFSVLLGVSVGFLSTLVYNYRRTRYNIIQHSDYFTSLLVPSGVLLVVISMSFLLFFIIAIVFALLLIVALLGGG